MSVNRMTSQNANSQNDNKWDACRQKEKNGSWKNDFIKVITNNKTGQNDFTKWFCTKLL